MNDKRREILLGYLLGALEPQESAKVDAQMQNNEDLCNDLATLCQEISPINEIADHYEPPAGLATRTCQNLWLKVDSTPSSHTANTLLSPKPGHKKHKISVVVSQNDPMPDESLSLPTPDTTLHTSNSSPHSPAPSLDSQDLNPDAVLPLSQALLLTVENPPGKPSKILRRVDHPVRLPDEPHLLLADSMIIVKNHPPKHYGRRNNNPATQIKPPWKLHDVFASLLVGLTAAVLVFPLVRLGINNVRERIIQQKVQNVANSMAPNTSQSSLYGLSPNDIRAFSTVTIDSQTATALHNQRQNKPAPFAEFQETPASTLLPVTHSSDGDSP